MPLPSSRDIGKLRSDLATWLGERVGAEVTLGELQVPEGSGFSSETFLFDATWPGQDTSVDAGRFVARMGPKADDFPVFASYDLAIQVNAMDLIRREAPSVPVANVRWYERSEDPLGSEFYVMDRIDGKAAPDNPPYVFGSWLTEASAPERRKVELATADIMAKIHAVTLDAVDMAWLSRPQHGVSPLDQHLDHQRWYYNWGREGMDFPLIEEALDWLEKHRPDHDPVGLNWGDARIGNIMFDDFDPVAVVDWEMACLGAPEADVVWVLMLHQFFLNILSVMEMENPFPDFFDVATFLSMYEDASGTKVRDAEWYAVFNHLRFAIISVRTSIRAISTGDMEPKDDPNDLVSNANMLRAQMAGTNPFWTA